MTISIVETVMLIAAKTFPICLRDSNGISYVFQYFLTVSKVIAIAVSSTEMGMLTHFKKFGH